MTLPPCDFYRWRHSKDAAPSRRLDGIMFALNGTIQFRCRYIEDDGGLSSEEPFLGSMPLSDFVLQIENGLLTAHWNEP